MNKMPEPNEKPVSANLKGGKYAPKPRPKPVYAGSPPRPNMNEGIHSPFTRDAYPALTDAILGVVNGQPRPVEENKYINKDGFLKTNPLKVGRGSHDKSSAYQQALKQKQNKTKAHGAGGKVVGEAVTPSLTDAILGVVNESHTRAQLEKLSITRLRELKKKYEALVLKGDKGASRELADIRGLLRSKGAGSVVDEAVTPAQRKVFNAERERMMTALNNPNKKLSPTEREAVLARGQRSAAAEVRKDAVSPTGVKSPVHAQAKAYHEYARKESKKMDAIAKRKSVKEAASPTAGKKPSNPFNPTLGDLLKSKQQDKKTDAKTKGVKEEVTPKRMEVLNRAVKTGMSGAETGYGTLGNAQSRALADRASLAITRAYATKGGKKVTGFDKAKREHEAAKARHKTLKSTPAGFNESQELDERIIDEVDAFQAAKNWVKGKGFKTNREVIYDRVNKNYAAMQKHQEAEAKKNK